MHIPPTAVITPLHSGAKWNIKYFNVPLSKFIYMNYAEIQPGEVLHLCGTENSGFLTERTSPIHSQYKPLTASTNNNSLCGRNLKQ